VRGPTFRGMTRLRRLLALTALVASVAVLGGCGGAGSPLQSLSLDQLTEAAATSAEASSGRFELSMEMTYPGLATPFAFSGDGAFDTEAKKSAFSFDLSSLAGLFGGLLGGLGGADAPDFGDPAAWRIDGVQDGSVVYMRFPAIAGELPAGKTWVRVDSKASAKAAGFDLSGLEQFTGDDPRTLLDFLKAVSGEIETVGSEELRGVTTTHYRATIDLRNYDQLVPPAQRKELSDMLGELVEQAGLSEMPFDVWLDDSGYIRKVAATFSASPSGQTGALEASMAFELFDYGADVDIDTPPADQVVDASALTG
jgi:hypothetical protein